MKGVVRPSLTARRHAPLHLDFLLVGVPLHVVVHVPTESDKKFVNEVAADLGLLIVGRQVVGFVRVECRDKFLHRRKSRVLRATGGRIHR